MNLWFPWGLQRPRETPFTSEVQQLWYKGRNGEGSGLRVVRFLQGGKFTDWRKEQTETSPHQTTDLLKQNDCHNINLSSRCSCTTGLASAWEKPHFLRPPTFRKSIQTKKPALRLRKGTPSVFSSSVTYVWAAFRRAWLAFRYTWLIQSDQKKIKKRIMNWGTIQSVQASKTLSVFFCFTLHLLLLFSVFSNKKKTTKKYFAVSCLCRRVSPWPSWGNFPTFVVLNHCGLLAFHPGQSWAISISLVPQACILCFCSSGSRWHWQFLCK